jgi:uncharacterized Ntn-hydrolase superfamily protein
VTYSIVAADPEAHEVGVATQSKFLAVGAVVPWASGDVGAVATQSFADATFGPRGLELLASGMDPQAAMDRLLGADEGREHRQVGIVDASGRSASFTGTKCFEHAASITGPGFACQGNILAAASVVPAMAESFERSAGRPLADRLVEALRAAQREGGDRRGMESAAILVAKPGAGYGRNNDRYLDLRVDHHDDPIEELARLLGLHRLYFERPRPSDVLEPDDVLEDELRAMLESLGKLRADQDLWQALEEYMGWENLEERWVGRGQLDPKVLEYVRQQARAQ